MSNLHLVPKYEGLRDLTKASTFIAQQKGIKNSQFRIVQDLRKINAATKNIKRTIPKLPEKIFQQLKGKIVSSIDANQAYWHLALHPDSRPYTCFYLHNRILQFNRVVQGLTSAPACWDEAMELIFSKETMLQIKAQLPPETAKLLPEDFKTFFTYYQDDSWTFSDTEEEHLLHLQAVLMAYKIHNIKISPQKSSFFPERFKILGVTFSPKEAELSLDILKAQSIIDWEKPDSLFTLQSRLYALNYWSKFIPSLSELKFPLNQILRSGIFSWTEEADLAWSRIKSIITLDIKLTIPYQDEKLLLTTDASKVACSCILWVLRNKQLKVVGCYSKLFSHTDSLKNIHFKETYALVLGLDHFRPYLLNTNQTITIFTDARALIWVGRNREYSIACNGLMNKLAKIQMEIPYKIYSVPSEVNYLADIFSRSFNSSRFLDKTNFSLSKMQANNIPPLTTPFLVEEDDLYNFFARSPEPEDSDKYSRKRNKIMTPKPIKSLYKLFEKCTPEEKYYSALRLLHGWNDPNIKKTPEELENNSLEIIEEKNPEDYKNFCNRIVKLTMSELYTNLDPDLQKRIEATLRENFKKLSKEKIQKTLKEDFLNHENFLNSLKISKTPMPNSSDIIEETENDVKVRHIQEKTTIFFSTKPNSQFLPKNAYESPGIDLPIQKELILLPNQAKIIDTEIQLYIPADYYAQICPRSSMAKLQIFTYNGVVDNDFSNYIQIIVKNNSPEIVKLKPGSYVAQALIIPVIHPLLQQKQNIKIISDRNDKGFGSSDKAETASNTIHLQHVPTSCLHSTINQNFNQKVHIMELNQNILFPEDNLSKQSILIDLNNSEKIYHRNILQNNTVPQPNHSENYEETICEDTKSLLRKVKIIQNNSIITENSVKDLSSQEIQKFKEEVYNNMCSKLSIISIDLIKNQTISREIFAKAQESDDLLSVIKNSIINNEKEFDKFLIKNSVLYKVIQDSKTNRNKYVLCIPDILMPSVIHTIHEELGHPSHTLTTRNFQNIYYNRLARKMIRNYVSSCITCSFATKYDVKKVQSSTARTMQPTRPRQCLYADLIPMIKGQFSYILFCLDAYSQYVYAIPLKDKTSPSILQGFLSLFASSGFYEQIYLDNETSFQSAAKLLIKIAPTKILYSTPYCHFQNSSENYIKNFKKAFLKLLNNPKNPQENQNWPLLLPTVTQSLNRQIINQINLSREAIHFNTTAIYHPFAEIINEDNSEYNEATLSLNENFFDTILKNRQKTVHKNHKNKVPTFQINQLVFMKDMVPGQSTILKLPNRGPYKITNIDERNVTLNDISTGKPVHTHIELIRPINVSEFRLVLSNKWDISSQHPKSNIKKSEEAIFENPTHPIPKNEIINSENAENTEIDDEINLEELFNPKNNNIQLQQQQPQPPTPTKQPQPQPPTPPPLLCSTEISDENSNSPGATAQTQQHDEGPQDEDHSISESAANCSSAPATETEKINTLNVHLETSQKYRRTLNTSKKEQVSFKLTKNM